MNTNTEFWNKYKATISIERLLSFNDDENPYSENFLLTLYESNIKISQAFYPVLSHIEIVLRNSIDTMLQSIISENWLENEIEKQTLLLDYDYKKLIEAYNAINTKYKPITRGKIISELTFGFWINLCTSKYNPRIWTKKGALKGVFINYPNNLKEEIHSISKKLTKIKKLRNRIFHYEPIINKGQKYIEVYNDIKEILSYLPNDNSSILNTTDNFVETIQEVINTLDKAQKK